MIMLLIKCPCCYPPELSCMYLVYCCSCPQLKLQACGDSFLSKFQQFTYKDGQIKLQGTHHTSMRMNGYTPRCDSSPVYTQMTRHVSSATYRNLPAAVRWLHG